MSLGDLVGLKGIGIHKSVLEPNKQSTVPHYHDTDEEWFYILKGNGKLILPDGDIDVTSGDFMGFPSGPDAEQYTHALKAGAEGMEYLCGGSRFVYALSAMNQRTGV